MLAGILLAGGVAFVAEARQSGGDQSLGHFRDWSAMHFGQGNSEACMAFSQPVKSTGKYTTRGDPFIFVTHRPRAGERRRVSVETGYTYHSDTPVLLQVDDLRVTLRTGDSTAWVEGDADSERVVRAMQAGRELVLSGTSSRGTATVDHYSLYGFSAAYAAISKRCPAP